MDNSTLASPPAPSKRPRRHLEHFRQQKIAAAVDVIVIRLRRDHFVDIKPVPFPVRGLANA
jgi:hypothetical protein